MATYKPKTYDLVEAFRVIENQLTNSMMRNISKHIGDEKAEGFNWSMWQAEQLNALHEYKLQSEKFFKNYSGAVSNEIDLLLTETYKNAQLQTEQEILQAIKSGYKTTKSESNFFKINEKKLNALMGATKSDFKDATKAMLRTSADEYRRIIFNAQVYANTGAGTVRQAIDMATKDFLSKGINCIEYKNGAKVPIDSYAEMALRTTNTRATLFGEGTKRKEWNVTTVIVTPNASGCPKCLEWVGKVYIDDVWSGGKSKDGAYPLLSTAIEGGLYHPNCRDSHSTYFEGVNSKPKPMTAEEKAEASRVYELQQQQRYCERNVRKYKRLAEYSLDPDNKAKYEGLRDKWTGNLNELVKNNSELRLKPERVKTYGIDITKLKFPTPSGIEKIETPIEYNFVDGENLLGKWERRADKFTFEIEDVMNAQGFDGLPTVVSTEEFNRVVSESNFIAQRTYSAPTQEILDSYRNELYNGKWYVDCSTGGAQYGQGMYCAADYTGTLTDGIRNEMKHYQDLNVSRGSPNAYTETFTLDKSAKIVTYEDVSKEFEKYKTKEYRNAMTKVLGDEKNSDIDSMVYNILSLQHDLEKADFYERNQIQKSINNYKKLLKQFHPKDYKNFNSYKKQVDNEFKNSTINNVGSYAVLNGYDAINAVGHGESGSYTVILNRTKLIIKRG